MHLTVIHTAIQYGVRIVATMQMAALQPRPILRVELNVHGFIALHCRHLSHGIRGLTPHIVVVSRSLRPHKLELKFALVVFAAVVKCVQDAVVRIRGVVRVEVLPLGRG